MGINQGFNKLSAGFSRKLTKSEIARGYLFVSNDKTVKKANGIEVIINGKSSGEKKIDNSGRIIIGKSISNQIGKNECSFLLENGKVQLTF